MNIEGLSATTLEKFIGHGWIKNFGDLYALEQHREDIIQTEGFGVKSYERLQESIEKSRHCTLAKFIAGLGIPMVGRHAGRDLDRYFGGSWEAFESAIQSGFDFTQLPNFGETIHNNIYKWYADEEEAKLWRPLLDKIILKRRQQICPQIQPIPSMAKPLLQRESWRITPVTASRCDFWSWAQSPVRPSAKHGLPDRWRKGRQQACKGAAARREDSDRTGI